MNEFAKTLIAKNKNEIIPEEYNYFGHFVGSWEMEWHDNIGTKDESTKIGDWIFSWVLEGRAVQDTFIVPSLKEDNIKNREYGTTIRIYNPDKKYWDIFYGCSGEATQLVAKKEDDKIVLTCVSNLNFQMKWIFSQIKENSFYWQHVRSFDNGKTWNLKAEAKATRI